MNNIKMFKIVFPSIQIENNIKNFHVIQEINIIYTKSLEITLKNLKVTSLSLVVQRNRPTCEAPKRNQ